MTHLMHLSCVSLVLVVIAMAHADDADPIADRLTRAKEKFDADMRKIRTSVLDGLTKEEDAARAKVNNKALVDKIQVERKAFEEKGELPSKVLPSIAQQASDARKAVDAAYKTAIREYTAKKQDAAATAVEKQLLDFRNNPIGLTVQSRITAQVVGKWVKDDQSGITFTIFTNGGKTNGKMQEYDKNGKPTNSWTWSVASDGVVTIMSPTAATCKMTMKDIDTIDANPVNPAIKSVILIRVDK
jgi:hypothetical protein